MVNLGRLEQYNLLSSYKLFNVFVRFKKKFEVTQYVFIRSPSLSDFIVNRLLGVALIDADVLTDMAKKIDTFHCPVNAPKKIVRMLVKSLSQVSEPNVVDMKMVQCFAPKHYNKPVILRGIITQTSNCLMCNMQLIDYI
jgi:hypothetical protein